MENPLISYLQNIRNDTYVPYDKILPEHFEVAFDICFTSARKKLEVILRNPEDPTFENTIEALEVCSTELDTIASIFNNFREAHTNEHINKLGEKVLPQLAEWGNDIILNEKLFERIKLVYDHKSQSLSQEQHQLLERKYSGFVRQGALLNDNQKKTLRKIDQKLVLLSQQFAQNLLNATNKYRLVISDPAQLKGIPERAIETAKEQAQEENIDGWVFTLKQPSYTPVINYAEDVTLRKEIFIAYNSRALHGEYDNQSVVLEIVKLRDDRAKLLGYKNYADYILEARMAKKPENVYSFFENLRVAAHPVAVDEIKELIAYKNKEFSSSSETIDPWDIAFYSEKLLKERHAFDAEEVRRYFSVDTVMEGLFEHTKRLYGISVQKRKDVPVYHSDVIVYEVFDKDNKSLGIVYFDFYPRESKRGGGWIDALRMQHIKNGVDIRPHMLIVCNLAKPSASMPGLLDLFEARTIFHEFGHALHCLFSTCTYSSLAGFNTLWDFVELPSQLMDSFLTDPKSIKLVAKHYKTGEIISDELVEKVIEAKKFQCGSKMLGQLGAAYLDMKWHDGSGIQAIDVESFEDEIKKDYRVLPKYPGVCQSTIFKHIFDGGYAVGYYSYHWSEVLAADAFEYFKEDGVFSEKVGTLFREQILSKGDTQDPAILYRNFRGRDADPKALLRKAGIKGIEADINRL